MSFLRRIIPHFLLNIYHWSLAFVGAFLYWFPSRKIVVIGVTGTNGKSTVIEILRSIFEEAGINVASWSSIQSVIAGEKKINKLKMTMPGRFALQHFLRDARKKGVTHAIIEVTSEGIRQYRHLFISWDAVIFTNLTPEHIESHGSFERYKKTKEKIFAYLSQTIHKPGVPKIIAANGDDQYAEDFLKYKADLKYVYKLGNKDLRFAVGDLSGDLRIMQPDRYSIYTEGIEFYLGHYYFHSKLLGEFNLYNILAAIACARAYGVSLDAIKKGVEKVESIPGRLEFIQREPFSVVVDYAHTPVALRNVYETLSCANQKSETRNPKLICVLGAAGGGRDKWKRKEFGKIASEFCGSAILTNEDPYDENPEAIIDEISSGFSYTAKSRKILDRREAIHEALKSARTRDVVIITGKGSEQWIMGANGAKTAWDDREVVRQELEKINNR